MPNPTPSELSFAELEANNARLRSEIVELRELYTVSLEKLGTVAAMIPFEPDKSLPVIVDQVQMKMVGVPALNQRTVEAAARWLEDHMRSFIGPEANGLSHPFNKDENSWPKYAIDAKQMIDAVRRR